MKKIGLLPSVRLFADNDVYNDRYTFINNYIIRIKETGAIPVGILGCNGYVENDMLDECDAFIIPGGLRIAPMHFQTVEYAVKTGKKLLGICMGAQAISSYFAAEDELERRKYECDKLKMYEIMKKEHYMFVRPVEHHWDVHMTRGEEDKAKHRIVIKPDTIIARLSGRKELMGASMHNYQINNPSPKIVVSGTAEDNCIECIEYGINILGVQFHPEVDGKNNFLFDFLVE